MEREIGEVFEYNGEKYVVAYDKGKCDGCAFSTMDKCNRNLDIAGHCIFFKRKDRNDVIFIKLKTENMEERTIKLSLEKAKEFYKKGGEFKDLALSAFSEKELEEIKLPKTWAEFCNTHGIKIGEYYINPNCEIVPFNHNERRHKETDKNIFCNKEAAEAHLALMQLHQLRDCYRQGWVPNLNNNKVKFCINQNPDYNITAYCDTSRFLSFQSKEIAEEFLNNFRDLIVQAGDLI